MGVPGTSGLPKVPASVLSTESTIIELKLSQSQKSELKESWKMKVVQLHE